MALLRTLTELKIIFIVFAFLVPSAKKKRDESPNVNYSTSSGASSSKSRGHMPVSERQQFALLKLMETKNPSSERCKCFIHIRHRYILISLI